MGWDLVRGWAQAYRAWLGDRSWHPLVGLLASADTMGVAKWGRRGGCMDGDRGGVLGRRVPRVEDQRLLTVGGTYVDDLTVPELAGAVRVTFVRSPIAHALGDRYRRLGRPGGARRGRRADQ
jgi:hypothetical protein